MRWWVTAVLAAALGFGAGRLGTRADGPTGRVTEAEALPPCPEVAPLARQVDARSRELGRLEARRLQGELAEVDAIGLPVEWPEDLPAAFRAQRVERAVDQALGEGELLTLDCAEYPCFVVVAYTSDDGDVRAQEAATREALEADGYTVTMDTALYMGNGREILVATHAIGAPRQPLAPERRRFREDELKASVEPLVDALVAGDR